MVNHLDLTDRLKSSLVEKFHSVDRDGSGGITLSEFVLFFQKFPSFKQELLKHAKSNAPFINQKALK